MFVYSTLTSFDDINASSSFSRLAELKEIREQLSLLGEPKIQQN